MLLACSLFPLPSSLLYSADFSGSAFVSNEKIDFTNVAATNWVNGELVLKFTTVGGTHGFTLPEDSTTIADVLVVGGGGAGGSGSNAGNNTAKNKRGAGGGGGAGGLILTNDYAFKSGTYAIGVGNGGLPSAAESGSMGGDGEDSSISLQAVDVFRAYAGGGGASEADGSGSIVGTKNIGSGGGGSALYESSTTIGKKGGLGTLGQGFAGGDGSKDRTAGGGGGAGGLGENGVTSNVGAAGGLGLASVIWAGTNEYYAAGGGSGVRAGTVGIGGSGIGGNGASVDETPATSGAQATGSGGGGGSLLLAGGAGGSGVVIVRISAVVKSPEKPVSMTNEYDGVEHVLVKKSPAYTIVQGGKVVDRVAGKNVGTYSATVTLKPGFTWADGSSDAVYIELKIEKANVEIIDLHMDNWAEGAMPPNPTCSLSIPGPTVTYSYGTSDNIEESVPEKPTAPGDYFVFAKVAGDFNWNAATASSTFQIFEQPSALFEDRVAITIDPYTGTSPAALTNFPYRLVLSEKRPVGFSYARAGADGKEICFADQNGNVLPHAVDSWDPNGESVVYVRIPLIGVSEQTIYLYWKTAEGKTAPAYTPTEVWKPWSQKEADDQPNKPSSEYGLVETGGQKVDYWVDKPIVSKTSWGVHPDPTEIGTIVTNGSLRSGRPVGYVIYDATTAQPLDPQEMPVEEGVYYILFSAKTPSAEYREPEPQRIDLRVIDRAPYTDLKDGMASTTLGGRMLLANGDTLADGATLSVTNGQAYWQVRSIKVGTRTYTFNPYWTHEGDVDPLDTFPYMYTGTVHKLNYIDANNVTNILWRLKDSRFGNHYELDKGKLSNRCYLPTSPTALGISTYANRNKLAKDNVDQIGTIVMRNTTDAAIYSPCYSNGIGTVFFDAVNGYTIRADQRKYGLVVEVATETKDGLPPTDENAGEELENITDAQWKRVDLLPLKCVDGSFGDTPQPVTDELVLDILKDKTDSNFYRVCAKVNKTGTIRFRIRRSLNDPTFEIDTTRFVIVDNVIVSFPTPTVTAGPYGTYDQEKTGKQTLGWEGAMANAAFPVAGEDILARTKTSISNAIAGTDPSTYIQLSKFHYRWRYLNQASNDWQSVDLRETDGFVATTPLDIPNETGDVEFWFETLTKIPFYDYVDYSGKDLKLGGLYSEEVGTVRYPADESEPPCFFRLRNGASEWDVVNVVLQNAGDAGGAHPMELISDHLWQGFVKIPTNVQGLVNFYFNGAYRWSAGAEAPVQSDVAWYPTSAVTNALPARGETSIGAEPHPFLADGATGFMEFQFNDETGVFSIGHAEYQNFNYWNDAKREDKLFVGSYSETSGVSVAAMMETNTNMRAWETLRTTDDNWNETFEMSNYETPAYQKNVTFATHKMPHQWNGDNGMFVDKNLTVADAEKRKTSSGIAWQMQGMGIGSLYFTQADYPSGLDRVTFTARLAQGVNFDEIAYCYADGMFATNNYTFVMPAILSYNSSSGSGSSADFAPGASMSIFGYYTPMVGCYEFRVSRDDSEGLRMSIYKWSRRGYRMSSELIGTHRFSSATFWYQGGSDKPDVFGMFISLGEDEAGKTTIIGGLSTGKAQPSSTFSGSNYRAIRCVDDTATRLTKGSFGVLPTSCNGLFVTPRLYSLRLTSGSIGGSLTAPSNDDKARTVENGRLMSGYYNSNKVDFQGSRDDTGDWKMAGEAWAYTPGRVELFENKNYKLDNDARGFRPPADLGQTVNLYLKSVKTAASGSDDAAWTLFSSNVVSSYSLQSYSLLICTNTSCHVMLKPGDAPADVTIGSVTQTGWNGADMPNPPDRDFMYTQAKVSTNIVTEIEQDGKKISVTNKYCTLQPARADPAKPLSIRGPILDHGIGMISFRYLLKDLDKNAEIWVQLSTNEVTRHMTGTTGLNQSIKEGTGPGEWETIRKYTYADLVAGNGELQYYIGAHDRIGDQLQGVLRICVPPSVVSAAAAATRADMKNGPKYGSITITGVTVRDEPAIDTSSWIGWNLRMIGDGADSEKRMYLPDLNAITPADSGLSAALNDSTTDDIAGDESEFDKVNPTIQSPTFRAGTIGMVRFRARVYDNSGVVGKPATVSLYGVQDAGGGDEGKFLTSFTVDSPRYEVKEWRASQEERYSSVKLVIDGVKEGTNTSARVLLEEVVVTEKLRSTIGFVYARPFRSHLDEDVALAEAEVRGMSEQPLTGESWGVQTRVKLDPYDKDIDREHGFRVTFQYYVGEAPWGYSNWKGLPAASRAVNLLQVGDEGDYIFRSTVSDPETIVKPVSTPNTTVQYAVTVHYRVKGDATDYESTIEVTGVEGDGWTNPTWYFPIDKNAGHPAVAAVPYTILDGMSPGRAWINEVNYNDGTRAEHGTTVVTNQFIEIAVPWGVDMTDWTVRLTDMDTNVFTIAKFGKGGLPERKMSMNRSGDYDFAVIASPKTTGSVRDAADATWLEDSSHSTTFNGGSLQYDQPYQIELVRPSGILEHQFVVMGTNEWSGKPYGIAYEGTNLLNELNITHPSVKRFFAGADVARRVKDGQVTFASLGVTGAAHGEEGGWANDMGFTPGRLNEGQDALTGWYLRPNGGSIWVYARVAEASRGIVQQRIGEDVSQDTYVILTSGGKTNVVYDVKPWFAAEADIYEENGPTNRVYVGTGAGATLNLNNVTATTWVVAHETIDRRLIDGGLDPNDRYTPAVMQWLTGGSTKRGEFKHPEGPVTNAIFRGLWSGATNCVLGLKEMYCLDIDPTEGGWWMRAGMTDFKGNWYQRVRKYDTTGEQDVELSDAMLKLRMYLSNDVSQVVYPPDILRGVSYGERSDDPGTYAGNWTGVTFKVVGKLSDIGMTTNLPFRCFTFAPGSFAGAEGLEDLKPFEAEIEIIDPFSKLSPGWSYGWSKYKGKSAFLMWWTFDERQLPIGVETLKAKSLYDKAPFYPAK